jgi:geranylgeranyl pyrophosphate synthase
MTAAKARVRIDTETLVAIINQCFDFAMDGRLKPRERKEFLVAGKRLRGTLVNMLTATFDESAEQFQDASKTIQAVNRDLKATKADIERAATTMANLATLAQVLDDLLKIASSFV